MFAYPQRNATTKKVFFVYVTSPLLEIASVSFSSLLSCSVKALCCLTGTDNTQDVLKDCAAGTVGLHIAQTTYLHVHGKF